MSWTYSDEYYKNYTRDTWNESAAHYAPMRANLDRYTPALLRLAVPRKGERVLDVATGPGEPALTLAPLVAPGVVVGVDLSEKMVALAQDEARRQKRANAEFRVMDAEALELPDASFDLVTNRFGMQIVTDPAKAAREAWRVLKPGGRFVASVWTTGDANPSIHNVVAPMLDFAEPDETGYLPTPYEMGGPGELARLLREAGFASVKEEHERQEMRFPDLASYERGILDGTPIGHSLREEDEATQKSVMTSFRANTRKWVRPDGSLAMPSEALLVVAVK